MPSLRRFGDGTVLLGDSYDAIMRRGEGRWEVIDTDGLPDAVESGPGDHQLYTYFNTGPTFVASPFRTARRTARL
ncbi:hypothetical protein BE20_05920 [Sorangium cellulosum]|nr:hypothetical protein BE20_05920 [Sorangium cellulosum]